MQKSLEACAFVKTTASALAVGVGSVSGWVLVLIEEVGSNEPRVRRWACPLLKSAANAGDR